MIPTCLHPAVFCQFYLSRRAPLSIQGQVGAKLAIKANFLSLKLAFHLFSETYSVLASVSEQSDRAAALKSCASLHIINSSDSKNKNAYLTSLFLISLQVIDRLPWVKPEREQAVLVSL